MAWFLRYDLEDLCRVDRERLVRDVYGKAIVRSRFLSDHEIEHSLNAVYSSMDISPTIHRRLDERLYRLCRKRRAAVDDAQISRWAGLADMPFDMEDEPLVIDGEHVGLPSSAVAAAPPSPSPSPPPPSPPPPPPSSIKRRRTSRGERKKKEVKKEDEPFTFNSILARGEVDCKTLPPLQCPLRDVVATVSAFRMRGGGNRIKHGWSASAETVAAIKERGLSVILTCHAYAADGTSSGDCVWPPGCFIRTNGKVHFLPPHSRDECNITAHLSLSGGAELCEAFLEGKVTAGVDYLFRISVAGQRKGKADLEQQLLLQEAAKKDIDPTMIAEMIQTISRMLDRPPPYSVPHIMVNLFDTATGEPIHYPGRTINCTHPIPFDVMKFIEDTRGSLPFPCATCPICKLPASVRTLYIDHELKNAVDFLKTNFPHVGACWYVTPLSGEEVMFMTPSGQALARMKRETFLERPPQISGRA